MSHLTYFLIALDTALTYTALRTILRMPRKLAAGVALAAAICFYILAVAMS